MRWSATCPTIVLTIAFATAAGSAESAGKEPEKGLTDKEGVIKFMKESFEAVRTRVPDLDRASERKLFGKAVKTDDVLLRLLVHNHEHMGQLIAYARTNGVVPPWTAARGQ